VDPITTLTVAYGAIKTGVKVGKDLQSLAGDIGKLWDSIDTIKDTAKKAKKKTSKGKSVNAEAAEIFMAESKAIQIENELREFITYEYDGPLDWSDMIRMRNEIAKQRQQAKQEELKRARQRREKILNALIIGGVTLAGIMLLVLAISIMVKLKG
jgi:hypothetical protein